MPNMEICVDASACKGMLLRTGAGRVKHLSTKQLWVQGAVPAYQIGVRNVGRDDNQGADALTHVVTEPVLHEGVIQMGLFAGEYK